MYETERRPWGFTLSLVLHILVAFALSSSSGVVDRTLGKPKRAQFTAAEKKRLVWYSFRNLPQVTPSREGIKRKTAKGTARQAITAPGPTPGKQFVYVKAPKIQLTVDLTAPNLVAIAPAPPPPPPPKIKPKSFIAPKLPERAAAANPVLDQPVPLAPQAPKLPATLVAGDGDPKLPAKPSPKTFVPPPNSPRAVAAAELAEAPAIAPTGLSSTVSTAIIGLNPANVPSIPLPEGSRQARIEAGSASGSGTVTSAGGGKQPGSGGDGAIVVPGLTVQGSSKGGSAVAPPSVRQPDPLGQPAQDPAAAANRPVGRFSTQTVSVPYWPNARKLSATVEARFRDRVVYATVIAGPRLAVKPPDWVLWFAELQRTDPTARPLVRPPVPIRYPPPGIQWVAANRESATIHVVGQLQKTGRLDGVTSVRGRDQNLVKAVVDVLQQWQFSPVYRDGNPVDVEILLEIFIPINRPPIETPSPISSH